ncbi:tetratricopeptide repeat-containing glycosyltransferase family 2 protein [Ligaoa zhengdingensis]|uniref:tetratricopeptide repeat-containing glycosyltransferase family 2 protein n=1 Tax=Ligaoa zhengdingensis TaxID=2763658 RepID=UPI0031B9E27E
MVTISLCMIVKDEEQNLPGCLDSVKDLVDEIVIVDTGSSDRTEEIARRYTDQVYRYAWRDDFAAARNFAFDHGAMQYCMWLDADDRMEGENREAFWQLKQTLPPDTDVVMMRYHTSFDQGGQPAFTYYRERLIRRAAGLRWAGAIHEAITPSGKVFYSEAAVSHRKTDPGDPDRNLRIFEGMLARGQRLSPREQFYYARELTYHARDGEAAEVLERFLDSGEGWVENEIEACRNLAACYERMGRPEEAFRALVRSLRFGPPRAETCCELGRFFLEREDYRTAVFWYEQALGCKREDASGGFVQPDDYGYVPCLQLCVCWYRLGDEEKAREYNERAGREKPESEAYRFNRAFFEGRAR